MKNKLVALVTMIIFIALVTAGCETTSNTNESLMNKNVTNSNTAILVNNNQADNMNSNANTNRSNANITREDVERDRVTYQDEAKKTGRKIGQGANDTWLWVKTRSSLAYADDLRDSTINVDVENDVVTLTGTVASAAQKTQAEKLAKDIEGVKSVQNKLVVKADASAPNTNTSNKNMSK